jgi:hypothetical protein
MANYKAKFTESNDIDNVVIADIPLGLILTDLTRN